MSWPDIETQMTTLCEWLKAATGIKAVFDESDFPKGPDNAVIIYESGGTYDQARGLLNYSMVVAVRGATLKSARKSAQDASIGLIEEFEKTPFENRNAIREISIERLPAFSGREKSENGFGGRVIYELGLTVVMSEEQGNA